MSLSIEHLKNNLRSFDEQSEVGKFKKSSRSLLKRVQNSSKVVQILLKNEMDNKNDLEQLLNHS